LTKRAIRNRQEDNEQDDLLAITAVIHQSEVIDHLTSELDKSNESYSSNVSLLCHQKHSPLHVFPFSAITTAIERQFPL